MENLNPTWRPKCFFARVNIDMEDVQLQQIGGQSLLVGYKTLR
jgi:hypothetical protein